MSKQIRFPDRCYVGMITRDTDDLPLAFMTEDGADKAAQKRKTTVDQWVTSAYAQQNKKRIPAHSYDNLPMAGFCLGKSIRRSSNFGSGNVMWRIEDPRGFQLEISSANMATIMDSTVIDRGEILNTCIWGRDGGNNILVPVSSELYQIAQDNAERLQKSASLRDMKVGNKVVFKNGATGVYLGKMFGLSKNYYRNNENNRWMWSEKATHLFYIADNNIMSVASPKISEIISPDIINPKEALKIALLHSAKRMFYCEEKVEFGNIKKSLALEEDLQSYSNKTFTTLMDGETVVFSPHGPNTTVTYVNKDKLDQGIISALSEAPNRLNNHFMSHMSGTAYKTRRIDTSDIEWQSPVYEIYYEMVLSHGEIARLPL